MGFRAAASVAHLRVISKRLPSASPRWSCSCTSSKLPTRAPRMHLFSDVKRRGGTCNVSPHWSQRAENMLVYATHHVRAIRCVSNETLGTLFKEVRRSAGIRRIGRVLA